MAPTIRSAFTSAQRRELDRLAELAAQTGSLNGAYDRARSLVLEGASAVDAARQAIEERARSRPR